MKENKNYFNSLTPKILDSKDSKTSVYIKALDYAFNHEDIKNIAITGIYGSGKSSVWRTYKNKRKLKNVITVSLGKYEDEIFQDFNIGKKDPIEESSNSSKSKNETKKSEIKKEYMEEENRVERQLINQISSQIKPKYIPLSKYRFKSNKSKLTTLAQALLTIFFIMSIIVWFTRDSFITEKIFELEEITIFSLLSFIVPFFIFLRSAYYNDRFKISRINLRGAEADFNNVDKTDETVLDRDIKELVYLLNSSKTEVVVFEDLDRYNDIEIYTKLRELNFLLNSYISKNNSKIKSFLKEKRTVRFIYLLKDGLFISKNRTKFFDFILPIVPVVDSNTSENQLLDLFSNLEYGPDSNIIGKVSLYIDDMRILKNIVNEYIVYYNVLPVKEIYLDKNKLFALVTVKNVFPYEFDLLQKDRGYIYNVLQKLEKSREDIVDNLENKILSIKETLEKDKLRLMASMIPVNVVLSENRDISWHDFLKGWSENQDDKREVKVYSAYSVSTYTYTYDEFLEDLILSKEQNKDLIEEIRRAMDRDVKELRKQIKELREEIKNVDTLTYKELLLKLDESQKNSIFETDRKISDSYYFPLIRFLISDGLLDETYWYYKGYFDVENSITLKENDIIYMKGLLEGQDLDVFLEIETPSEVCKRLEDSDFSRFNILNKRLLEYCIEQKYLTKSNLITDTSIKNNKIDSLVEIISGFDYLLLEDYISSLTDYNSKLIINILDKSKNYSKELFKNILKALGTNEKIEAKELELFKQYIDTTPDLITLIEPDRFEIFISNISSVNIKFTSIVDNKISTDRLRKIENILAYKLSVENIFYISERLLNEKIEHGELLGKVYESEDLNSSKEYINDNFTKFVCDYMDKSKPEDSYNNSEEILIKILLSKIPDDYKLEYIDKNKTKISNLKDLEEILNEEEIINKIFDQNIITFNEENISFYWNSISEYHASFREYIERNINEKNKDSILKNNKVMLVSFINDPNISNHLFNFILPYLDEKIENIDPELSSSRARNLIKICKLAFTEDNIKILLENSYYEEIILFAESLEENLQKEMIEYLLSEDLDGDIIYSLINSNISYDNLLYIVEELDYELLIENIDNKKKNIIIEIIRNNLSDENIDYLAKNFKQIADSLKSEFVNIMHEEYLISDLNNKQLNNNLLYFILEDCDIETDIKIDLIITKINNDTEISEIKKYIEKVDEIQELKNAWDGGYPKLDNEYKERIAEALLDKDYVKETAHKDIRRIMLT